MSTKRTDNHTPSRMVPSDYSHRLAFAYGGNNEPPIHVDLLIKLREQFPFFKKPSGGGGCDVCGAHFRYGSVFVHNPTGEHIVVGWECADKIELTADMGTVRREVMSKLERARKLAERRWALRKWVKGATPELRKAVRVEHRIIADIRQRLIQFGTMSDRQAELVLKLAREAAERANRPAEKKVPAPTGKLVVRGEVISVKWTEGAFSNGYKVTVKVATPDGVWLAWGTLPGILEDEHTKRQRSADGSNAGIRGEVIEFCATVTPSDRDPGFAFFKRPTKPRLVPKQETAASS